MRGARTLLLFERGGRLLVRLMPARLRAEWGDDLDATYIESCRAAYARGGARALLMEGPRELVDLGRAALRAHRASPRLPGIRAPE